MQSPKSSYPFLSVNPELQRNLWLELTPSRLLTMPMILGGIFSLFFIGPQVMKSSGLSGTALGLYCLFSLIWAPKLVTDSIIDEVKMRTWDIQRMSSIQPWTLTWGKLFGSAIYAWYGSFICLGVYASQNLPQWGLEFTLKRLLFLLLCAILAQSLAFLSAAETALPKPGQRLGRDGMFLGIAAGLIALSSGDSASMFLGSSLPDVLWYDTAFPAFDFILCSTGVFAAWFIFGSYRLIRRHLQFQVAPFAWTGFLVFSMVYFSGFAAEKYLKIFGAVELVRVSTCFVIAAGACYMMIFSEKVDRVNVRRMIAAFKEQRWGDFLVLTPCWSISLILAAALAIYAEVNFGGTIIREMPFRGFALSALLFLVRDMLLFVYVYFGAVYKRWTGMALAIYLGVLYILLPAITSTSHGLSMLRLFYPVPGSTFLQAVLPPLAQCLILGLLVKNRWSSHRVELAISEQSIKR